MKKIVALVCLTLATAMFAFAGNSTDDQMIKDAQHAAQDCLTDARQAGWSVDSNVAANEAGGWTVTFSGIMNGQTCPPGQICPLRIMYRIHATVEFDANGNMWGVVCNSTEPVLQ